MAAIDSEQESQARTDEQQELEDARGRLRKCCALKVKQRDEHIVRSDVAEEGEERDQSGYPPAPS